VRTLNGTEQFDGVIRVARIGEEYKMIVAHIIGIQEVKRRETGDIMDDTSGYRRLIWNGK